MTLVTKINTVIIKIRYQVRTAKAPERQKNQYFKEDVIVVSYFLVKQKLSSCNLSTIRYLKICAVQITIAEIVISNLRSPFYDIVGILRHRHLYLITGSMRT